MEKDDISKGLEQTDLAGSCEIGVNDAGTVDQNDTPLTQWRSPTVRTLELLGFTYFIRVGAAIKIGSATNFERRLSALQTAHEKPIEVLAVVPASVADEYSVHQLFAKLRVRGEWFTADRELLYFIEKVKADAVAAQPGYEPSNPMPLNSFDLARRNLHALRKGRRYGDPVLRCCHNFLQQIGNYEQSED